MKTITEASLERERRRTAREFAETKQIIEAAVAPPAALLDRIARLEDLVRDQGAKLVELEAAQTATDDREADGKARLGKWMKLKAAARRTGYSESGLRKLARQGRIIADFGGPHMEINVSSVPSKVLKVSKV